MNQFRYNKTEREGVNECRNLFEGKLGWLFKEMPPPDCGIDAFVEEVIDNNPTGRFIGIQIKSGEGNFYQNKKGFRYYIKGVHAEYWLNSNIPIILFAYFPKTGKSIWQHITLKTVITENNTRKVDIPFTNLFTINSGIELQEILNCQFKSTGTSILQLDNLIEENGLKCKQIADIYTEITHKVGITAAKYNKIINGLANLTYNLEDQLTLDFLNEFCAEMDKYTAKLKLSTGEYIYRCAKLIVYLEQRFEINNEDISEPIKMLIQVQNEFSFFINSLTQHENPKYPKNYVLSVKELKDAFKIVLNEIIGAIDLLKNIQTNKIQLF